jgi:dUTP pyrophosphatase
MRVVLKNRSGYGLSYKTALSAGLDVITTKDITLPPLEVIAVPTGLWIESYDLENSMLGEIQVRLRSSLAYKNKVILANGVGTIDLDYPDEIKLLLLNLGKEPLQLTQGDRIGQLVLNSNLDYLLGNNISVSGEVRTGGLGSTGKN